MIESLNNLPLLSLLIVTLPVGAVLIWIIPNPRAARWVALITALVDLSLALLLLSGFDITNGGFQYVETMAWIPTLNINYVMGIDGITVLFLPLTVILFIGVILSSWNSVHSMPKLYYTLLLLLESTTLGVFCALDTILFFLFWELTLIPLYFLISFWGIGPNRRHAAVKYTMFMLAGGIPLLVAFVLLAFNHATATGVAIPAGLGFDYLELLKTPVSSDLQVIIFLLLLVGFGVKTPVFPLHTWLPEVAMEGPIAIAALLTGLKLGAYGLIRFTMPLAGTAAQQLHWLLAGLGIIAVLYGAYAALSQTNIRRMLAYASLSHVGLVVLGISSFNQQGLQGAVFMLLNFTLISGGLFLLTGLLHQRVGSSDLIALGGAARSMPMLASFYFIFGMAAMGIPGTSGFVAEFLLILSAIKTHTGAGIAALFAAILGAAYFLRQYRRTFFGPVTMQTIADAEDLKPRELMVAVMFTVLILLGGLIPGLVLDITDMVSREWVGRITTQ
ncbi:MAG: NADH-quinone oxidoreductase subunit M [Proteobacteria bacterium]|nr:NADH-quinone oxidoreductase subunit M [Pseudomonadota bacterium]